MSAMRMAWTLLSNYRHLLTPSHRPLTYCAVFVVSQVHRHHPPAVYGRTMGGTPESSEGAAIFKVENGLSGGPAYGFISYQ